MTVFGGQRMRTILLQSRLTRTVIQRVATQRSRPDNLQYARDFVNHVSSFHHAAWQDESGINKHGMLCRRCKGWGVEGDGCAYLPEDLRSWPRENVTVMSLFDREGFFGIDMHTGGTDGDYCDSCFRLHAWTLSQRGVDALIIHNCPAHRIANIMHCMNRLGIAVVALPTYWPQWNPIELAWNTMKDSLGPHLALLNVNPRPVITTAMETVTPQLARAFIRHCTVYPDAWSL